MWIYSTSTWSPLVGNDSPLECNKTFIENVDSLLPCEDDQDCQENKDGWLMKDVEPMIYHTQGIESDHNIRLNLSTIDIYKFKNIVNLQSHLVLVSEIVWEVKN